MGPIAYGVMQSIKLAGDDADALMRLEHWYYTFGAAEGCKHYKYMSIYRDAALRVPRHQREVEARMASWPPLTDTIFA